MCIQAELWITGAGIEAQRNSWQNVTLGQSKKTPWNSVFFFLSLKYCFLSLFSPSSCTQTWTLAAAKSSISCREMGLGPSLSSTTRLETSTPWRGWTGRRRLSTLSQPRQWTGTPTSPWSPLQSSSSRFRTSMTTPLSLWRAPTMPRCQRCLLWVRMCEQPWLPTALPCQEAVELVMNNKVFIVLLAFICIFSNLLLAQALICSTIAVSLSSKEMTNSCINVSLSSNTLMGWIYISLLTLQLEYCYWEGFIKICSSMTLSHPIDILLMFNYLFVVFLLLQGIDTYLFVFL